MCHAGTWLSAVLIVEQMDSFHSMILLRGSIPSVVVFLVCLRHAGNGHE